MLYGLQVGKKSKTANAVDTLLIGTCSGSACTSTDSVDDTSTKTIERCLHQWSRTQSVQAFTGQRLPGRVLHLVLHTLLRGTFRDNPNG